MISEEEARGGEYYFEPRRDPVTGEELLYDIEKARWTTIPCTSGMEIEQLDRDIMRCERLTREYEWHYDGSGPYETALLPSIAPYEQIKKFVGVVLEEGCMWEWKNSIVRRLWYGEVEKGCGSHIHMRPRPSKLHKEVDAAKPPERQVPGLQDDPEYEHPDHVTLEDVWATAHNTLIEVFPWILPLFCAGYPSVFAFRPEATFWAKFDWRRMSPDAFREFLSPSYLDHPYVAVAPNRKTREKPLTLELRLNEAHPCIAYVTIILLNRIIRKCYERGYVSPKLALASPQRMDLYNALSDAVVKSRTENRSLYEVLEEKVEAWVREHGKIAFEPGREIPLLKREYDSYYKLFRDIMYYYLHFMSPPEYRVYLLFRERGNPRRNWRRLWYVMHAPKGEFYWEEPYISGL
jgi:hypothetical protein